MVKESDIKAELLKQMGRNSDEAAGANTNSVREVIAKEEARIRRTKWETVIAWVLVVVCFMIGAVVERFRMDQHFNEAELIWSYCLPMILPALLLSAVIFTVLLYTRSRALTMRQIQARLADIEAILKKMAGD
jgi:NADH:ubiquinone oxidoreductase subunit 6 (subunit J)